jgi:hypothetical protein
MTPREVILCAAGLVIGCDLDGVFAWLNLGTENLPVRVAGRYAQYTKPKRNPRWPMRGNKRPFQGITRREAASIRGDDPSAANTTDRMGMFSGTGPAPHIHRPGPLTEMRLELN